VIYDHYEPGSIWSLLTTRNLVRSGFQAKHGALMFGSIDIGVRFMINIQERADGVTVECYVTPRAAKSRIKGERNGALAVALNAPPVEGRANEALIEFIAESLSIPKSRVSIIRGETSRKKLVFIQGARKEQLLALLT